MLPVQASTMSQRQWKSMHRKPPGNLLARQPRRESPRNPCHRQASHPREVRRELSHHRRNHQHLRPSVPGQGPMQQQPPIFIRSFNTAGRRMYGENKSTVQFLSGRLLALLLEKVREQKFTKEAGCCSHGFIRKEKA